MTIGTFLPLVTAIFALIEIPIFLHWRSTGKITESAFPFMAIATLIVPVALYFAFKLLVPDVGAIELF